MTTDRLLKLDEVKRALSQGKTWIYKHLTPVRPGRWRESDVLKLMEKQ